MTTFFTKNKYFFTISLLFSHSAAKRPAIRGERCRESENKEEKYTKKYGTADEKSAVPTKKDGGIGLIQIPPPL